MKYENFLSDTAKQISTMTVNTEETKEVVDSLKEESIDVEVENIAEYLKTQGVVVKVHIGGGRKEFYISEKIYGINEEALGDEAREFMKEHVKKGKISFLPASYDNELKRIDAKLRKKKREMAIGYEDSFMPIPIFKEFKAYFEECAIEYMSIRDKIVSQYEYLVKRFSSIVEKSLKELNAIDAEKEYRQLMSYIPHIQYYEDSFYINLSVRAFPSLDNLDVFDERIREEIREGVLSDSMDLIKESMGKTLNDAFVAISNVLNGAVKDVVHPKTIEGVENAVRKIAQKNIFHNAKIDEVREKMIKLMGYAYDLELLCEKCELLLSEIYIYSRGLKVSRYLETSKCLLTIQELNEIYEEAHE